MKSKKINKIIITVACVIGIVIIGIVLCMVVINNNSYKSLDLKYESTSKYTITSGSTGNVYDLSKEERKEFFKIIYSMGGMLTSVEASETPTRSYIVDISAQDRNILLNKKADERIMSDVMDAVLDEIIK